VRLHPHEGFDNFGASLRQIGAIPLAAAMAAPTFVN
jgi:hypothetical protein